MGVVTDRSGWGEPMPVTVTCTRCGKRLSVPEQYAGKRGRCKTCGEPFLVSAAAGAGAQADSYAVIEPPVAVEAEPSSMLVRPRATSDDASSRKETVSSGAT